MRSTGGSQRTPSVAGTLVLMVAGVVVGLPMVAYLWETLHLLLALHVDGRRLSISLPVLVLLVLWLRFLGRRLQAATRPEG